MCLCLGARGAAVPRPQACGAVAMGIVVRAGAPVPLAQKFSLFIHNN